METGREETNLNGIRPNLWLVKKNGVIFTLRAFLQIWIDSPIITLTFNPDRTPPTQPTLA